jgi:peptidoglycan/xylan/chitin deacetylase (PgdA/CDA1 family)
MATDITTRLDAARPKLAASASTVITLPFFAILGLSAGWPSFLGTLVLVIGGVLLGAAAPKSRGAVVLAAAMVVVAAFGIAQSQSSGSGVVLAPVLGIAAGLVWPGGPFSVLGWDRRPDFAPKPGEHIEEPDEPSFPRMGTAEKAPVVVFLLAYVAEGRVLAAVLAALYFVFVAAVVASGPFPATQRRIARVAAPAAAALLTLVCISIVGATTPRASWFGALISNGPRETNMVALTFDDGPNGEYTTAVSQLLAGQGVKGTFFVLGSATKERPVPLKQLLADGHLIANHAYEHNNLAYLNPFYPELGKAQRAIRDEAGVCPAFFRPPHGTHTPFMSRVANRRNMHVVNWDVSAADWATDDPDLVALRVLEKVKPGSIILLHDGLDGRIGADRSVVVKALPLIIQGLRDKGLKPVRLDELLNIPGYVDKC